MTLMFSEHCHLCKLYKINTSPQNLDLDQFGITYAVEYINRGFGNVSNSIIGHVSRVIAGYYLSILLPII